MMDYMCVFALWCDGLIELGSAVKRVFMVKLARNMSIEQASTGQGQYVNRHSTSPRILHHVID
jgi:hypothetical protein